VTVFDQLRGVVGDGDLDDLLASAKANNMPAVSYVKAERYQTGHAGGISNHRSRYGPH